MEGGGKRQKEAEDDDMDMEVEETGKWSVFDVVEVRVLMSRLHGVIGSTGPRSVVSNHPSSTLRCENLPTEVTDDVLAVLFQQYVPSVLLHTPHTSHLTECSLP